MQRDAPGQPVGQQISNFGQFAGHTGQLAGLIGWVAGHLGSKSAKNIYRPCQTICDHDLEIKDQKFS